MVRSLKPYFVVFAGPTFAAFAIAFLVPFGMGLYLSFTEFTTLNDAEWVGFDNYVAAFSSRQHFIQALLFTGLVAIVSIVTVNLGAFTLAYFLTRKLRGTNFFRTVFFMPNLIGGLVLGYTWQEILNAILRNWGQTVISDWRLRRAGHADQLAAGRVHDDHLHRRPAERSAGAQRGG